MKNKKIALVFPYAEPETGAPIARIKFFRKILKGAGFETMVFAPVKKNLGKSEQVVRFKGIIDLFKKLYKEKPCLAIASGPPATIIFNSVLCSKLLRFPLIADIRDPWVESKVAIGLLNENSFKYLLQKKYEQIAYFLSDKVFVVSEAIAEILRNKLKVKKEKITIVEHSIDLKIFRRNVKEGNKVKKELAIEEEPVLIYVGNAWVGVDKMIKSLSKILLETNAFLIVIVSKNPSDSKEMFEKIEKAVKRNKVSKNVRILYNVPHHELYKYLSAADLGLNIIPKKLTYVISNKVKEYIACGVPVACKCSKNCYSKKIIETYKIGFTSNAWGDFIQKIKKIILSKQKLEEMKKNALKTAKKFSYEKIGKKALAEIKDCLK